MERFLRWTRPGAVRVLRFDSACGAEGCGIALRAMNILPPAAAEKPYNRASPDGNAPLLPTASPPKGEICSTLTFDFILNKQQFVKLATFGGHPLSGCAGLLHGKASHEIFSRLRLPTNFVRLPPLFRGQNKPQIRNHFISTLRQCAAKTSPSGVAKELNL